MSSLHLHTSIGLGPLARSLADLLRSNESDGVLVPQIVVVPSLAMRRWLTLELARLNQVAANIEFPFVGDFIASLPDELLRESGLARRFDANRMLWEIHARLSKAAGSEIFAAASHYLHDGDALRTYQLAARVTAAFDQYVVYRPDMLTQWERSPGAAAVDEAWQAALWQETSHLRQGTQPRENEGRRFAGLVASAARVIVFGVTEMAPAYLELLFKYAADIPVHLFVTRCSDQYYADELTARQRIRPNQPVTPPSDVNPLLISLGQTGSRFTSLLLEFDGTRDVAIEYHEAQHSQPEPHDLLSSLQHDIVTATNRGQADAADLAPPFVVAPDDRSLVVHSCHSPMREVEVLYDQLLALFEECPDLRPRDVLVMAPDIEKYSPLIHAVFAYPEDAHRRIPYSISDRAPRTQSETIDCFFQLLERGTSRCTAEEIYGILSSALVSRRFNLSPADLALLHTWLRDTQVRWGIDEEHKRRLELPPNPTNTWRFGLRRMLLGYAMTGDNQRAFEHILPYDEIEGERGELLGRFVKASETVLEFVSEIQVARPLRHWPAVLLRGVSQLLESDDEEHVRDLRFLRKTLSAFGEATGPADSVEVGVTVIREHLLGLLGTMKQRGGFLTGGVTFCALKPGRSIPSRVIYLLGMGDGFPRRPRPAQFDLMAKVRRGDPSPRDDDRYAFLETINAASERLHISYVGRSIIENKEIPPSVVVSELLDYLEQSCRFGEGVGAHERLITQHPMQAFSPANFLPDPSRPFCFSYSAANAKTAAAIAGPPRVDVTPFVATELPLVSTTEKTITLEKLAAFLAAPSEFFLSHRFHIRLKDYGDTLENDEPIELSNLEKYQIRTELLRQQMEGGQPDLELFQSRGLAASGATGAFQLAALDRESQTLKSTLDDLIKDSAPADPVPIRIALADGWELTGSITPVYDNMLLISRSGRPKLKYQLLAWVHHLGWCATTGHKKLSTVLVGLGGGYRWNYVEDAPARIKHLCELYISSLRMPLEMFPESGAAYVSAELEGKPGSSPAWNAWKDANDYDKEGSDPSIGMLFPEAHPLHDIALANARAVLEPMLRHREEVT